MTYVMSDIHGDYESYIKMLEKICFTDDDVLYINGDICDRGESSAKIYLDVMSRNNVIVIKGNHELMAEEHLEYLVKEEEQDEGDFLKLCIEKDIMLWFENGGGSTLESLFDESEEDRLRIFDFIRSLPYYRAVDINGKHYVIVHGGLGEEEGVTDPAEVVPIDLVWSRPDFDGQYLKGKNTYLIVGHTPTFPFCPTDEKLSIYHGKGNVIAIDCGAAYPEYRGRLGCLCLDTLEEFYV